MIGPLMRQYAVVAAVNLCSLSIGLALGWSSPGLLKLKDANQTSLSRPITEEEGSWIVSLTYMSSILLTMAAAFLMDIIGRKYSIIGAAVLKVFVGVMLTLARDTWMLLMARALIGGLDAILYCVIPAYASEVASKEIRGALGAILNLFITFGLVVMLSVGPFCSYLTMNVVYTVLTFVATVPLVFLPESPYFLYAKGRKEESIKVLTFLRGSKYLVNEEIKQYMASNGGQRVNRWLLFKDRVFLKSLWISVAFIVGGQMAGHNAILSYLQTILVLSDTNVKPEIASIVIGCVLVIASTCTLLFSDKFGRKPIMAFTLIGAAIGLLGLGVFFRIQESGYATTGIVNYLPVVSLVLFYFCQGFGFSSISFIIVSELFDSPARATGMSVMLLASDVVLFLSGCYFVDVVTAIGASTVYWLFCLDCVLTCVFVVMFVPETKGTTFVEIQEKLGKKCDAVSTLTFNDHIPTYTNPVHNQDYNISKT